jgi:hypothetical protein
MRSIVGRILAAAGLLACADPEAPSTRYPRLISREIQPGIAGYPAPDSVVVRVVGNDNQGVPAVPVYFAATSGGGNFAPSTATTDADGYARSVWRLGSSEEIQQGRAGLTAPAGSMVAIADALPTTLTLLAQPLPVSTGARDILGWLGTHISIELANQLGNLPRNPNIASHIEAKIALLRTPGLGGDILLESRYLEDVVEGTTRMIPLLAVFPLETMRTDAATSIDVIQATVPILENFVLPFPTNRITLWHGFGIGNSGGGGAMNMEDRASWVARAVVLPYDAVIAHELGHSYTGNEALTQFLEIYAHNVRLSGSTDLASWAYKRGYPGSQASNVDVHALLDIYALVGPSVMSQGYRNMYPLHPAYGQALSPAVQQAFLDAVPGSLKAQVAEKLTKVRF